MLLPIWGRPRAASSTFLGGGTAGNSDPAGVPFSRRRWSALDTLVRLPHSQGNNHFQQRVFQPMGFKCGIVGLPNVGKSTLFNALTKTAAAQAANYPFCTIEPNTGEVAVPDPRMQQLEIGRAHV